MARYSAEDREDSHRSLGPHQDYGSNCLFFRKVMDRTHWIGQGIFWGVPKDRNNAWIAWTENQSRRIWSISFHEPYLKFKEETCCCLNYLGSIGQIEHRFKTPDRYTRQIPLPKRKINTETEFPTWMDE